MASTSVPPDGAPTPRSVPPTIGTQSSPPSQTWMPVAAGVLTIVAGVLDLFVGAFVGAIFHVLGAISGFPRLGAIGIPLVIFGIVAIIGGAFATQRKVWIMALIGSICALMWPFTLLGILAIIFVSISKNEFN